MHSILIDCIIIFYPLGVPHSKDSPVKIPHSIYVNFSNVRRYILIKSVL